MRISTWKYYKQGWADASIYGYIWILVSESGRTPVWIPKIIFFRFGYRFGYKKKTNFRIWIPISIQKSVFFRFGHQFGYQKQIYGLGYRFGYIPVWIQKLFFRIRILVWMPFFCQIPDLVSGLEYQYPPIPDYKLKKKKL